MLLSQKNTLNKIMRKLSFEVNKAREYFLFRINKYNSNLVVFEGGLGSQLFSYFQFDYLIRNRGKVEINLEYFHIADKADNDFTEKRDWALDRYGITKELLKNQATKVSKSSSKIPTNLLGSRDKNYFKKYLDLNLAEKFPIDEVWRNNFLIENNIGSNFYAIHIRRGDFLTVASKLISDEEISDLSLKLFTKLPKLPVLIFSDSDIDIKWNSKFKNIGFDNIKLIDRHSCSDLYAHDLLRSAKILIASNSFFSLSAAVLSVEDQLAFIPMEFYSGYRDEPINELINKLSKFSVFS